MSSKPPQGYVFFLPLMEVYLIKGSNTYFVGPVTIAQKILRSLFSLLLHKFDEASYDGLLVIFFACIAIF